MLRCACFAEPVGPWHLGSVQPQQLRRRSPGAPPAAMTRRRGAPTLAAAVLMATITHFCPHACRPHADYGVAFPNRTSDAFIAAFSNIIISLQVGASGAMQQQHRRPRQHASLRCCVCAGI